MKTKNLLTICICTLLTVNLAYARWPSVDPHAENYYPQSPYSFVGGNPINKVDPDGRDSYLVIWLTEEGKVGHAGFAIDNYQRQQVYDSGGNAVLDAKGNPTYEMVADGTVTYMDLWPGNEDGVGIANSGSDVDAYYSNVTTTVNEIMSSDITGSEGYAPQGVVKIKTDYKTDVNTKQAMSKFMTVNVYNGRSRNCSDFAQIGVEQSLGVQINAKESIMFKKSTTPNALYRATISQNGVTILKNPGMKVNKTFIDGYKGR